MYLSGEEGNPLIKQVKGSNLKINNTLFTKGDSNTSGKETGSSNNPAPTNPGASNPSSTNVRSDTPRSTTSSGTTFTDFSEIPSVSAPSRPGGSISNPASGPRPSLPPVGSVSNLTPSEARAMYIRLQLAYVNPSAYSIPSLRADIERSASTMTTEALKASIRNIRHHGSYDPNTNPHPVRTDTP